VKSADEAKDIYQEVFLRVYRNLKDFRFRSEFSTWLYRITVNVCLTHLSANRSPGGRRQRGEDPEEDSPTDGDIADPARGPDDHAVATDIADRISRALDGLAPKHRMAFTLRHLEGLALKEIAESMDCAEGTVKRYLFDATRKLRTALRDLA
jgi:RNA polymerase sigma-70 factor (ECF subfamily)